MAAIQRRGDSFRMIFRFQGKQISFTLGDVELEEAEAKAAQADYLLLRIKQRLVEIPRGVDIVQFIQFDGRATAPAQASPPAPKFAFGGGRDVRPRRRPIVEAGNQGLAVVVDPDDPDWVLAAIRSFHGRLPPPTGGRGTTARAAGNPKPWNERSERDIESVYARTER